MGILTTKAIVTGHSRGLGAAIAEILLTKGISVLGISRKSAIHLAPKFPGLLTEVALDLADTEKLANWLNSGVLAHFAEGADSLLVINNAGVLGPIGPLGSQDVVKIADAVAINVTAPLMLSSHAAQLACSDIRILHVSSGAARDAYPGWSVYCATKAALDHHARSVQTDAQKNIRICSLAPGVVDTDMQAEIRATEIGLFPLLMRFVGLKQDNQLTQASDAAEKLVSYLCSESFGRHPTSDLRQVSISK